MSAHSFTSQRVPVCESIYDQIRKKIEEAHKENAPHVSYIGKDYLNPRGYPIVIVEKRPKKDFRRKKGI